MKKIININLAGRVIPIEDSAYEKLQGYIESLRRYFALEEGRDEIINDIESRVAELMSEKVRKGATAVTDEDIEEIIKSMGRPEDLAADDIGDLGSESSTGNSSYSFSGTETGPKKTKGRFYRNLSDRFLGGVCSGTANYLNVDPAIIRLLFAIITFGGFGFGILLYILLWIILPAKPLEGYTGKRLFRNPDDRILGGVSGGLAAYFGKETWMIRLIFAAPLLLNVLISMLNGAFMGFSPFPLILFGSLTGTFLLAYIILWVVLPEANSPYEKMEMRGEKVDVNTIKQNVQEGMQQFKGRAEQFGEEVKTSAQELGARAKEFANTRGKTFAAEVGQVARPMGSRLGNVIRVLFKAFFLLVGGSIAFALFIGLIILIFGGVGLMPFKNFLLDGFWQNFFAWGTVILFLGVPLVAFFTWLVRRLMRVKSQQRYLGWMFGGLWILGWICVTFLIATIFKEIRNFEKVEERVEVSQPANGRMLVRVNEPELNVSNSMWWFNDGNGNHGWDIDEDTLRLSNIKIRISKSEDSAYHVIEYKTSAGRNRSDAENRAAKVQYNISSRDSILNLGSGLAIGRDSKFRGQQVIVEIQVPVGKKIRFDESVDERLHPYSIRTKENYNRKRTWGRHNWDVEFDYDRWFNWEINTDYVMNAQGELINPEKPVAKDRDENSNDNDTYRYDSKEQKQKEYEEQKRIIEEQQQKLRQLEQELKKDSATPTTIKTSTTSAKKISMDDEADEEYSFIHSPVFSFVKFDL